MFQGTLGEGVTVWEDEEKRETERVSNSIEQNDAKTKQNKTNKISKNKHPKHTTIIILFKTAANG